MNIYVDIDETICVTPEDRDYSKSVPIHKHIRKVNELYDEGHTIIYWTARGNSQPNNKSRLKKLAKFTKKQLDEWGVKYHDIKTDKPSYDLFICDKVINSIDFFTNPGNIPSMPRDVRNRICARLKI